MKSYFVAYIYIYILKCYLIYVRQYYGRLGVWNCGVITENYSFEDLSWFKNGGKNSRRAGSDH